MELTDIKTITNVGAGTMGHATALQFALAGYLVRLYDHQQAGLQRGKDAIAHDLATFEQAGLLKEQPAVILERITYTTDMAAACQIPTLSSSRSSRTSRLNNRSGRRLNSWLARRQPWLPTHPA